MNCFGNYIETPLQWNPLQYFRFENCIEGFKGNFSGVCFGYSFEIFTGNYVRNSFHISFSKRIWELFCIFVRFCSLQFRKFLNRISKDISKGFTKKEKELRLGHVFSFIWKFIKHFLWKLGNTQMELLKCILKE